MKLLAVMVVLMLAGATMLGCGGGASGEVAHSTQTAKVEAGHGSENSDRAINTGGESYLSAEEQAAYRTARQTCLALGPQGVASTYGGGPSQVDIALSYTTTVFDPRAGGAATQGCLDGFKAR